MIVRPHLAKIVTEARCRGARAFEDCELSRLEKFQCAAVHELEFFQSARTCVERCQVHKTRNILDYLPDGQRPWAHAILRRAYAHSDPAKARRLLEDLARRLDDEFPSAAESVREGLDETLTVLRLSLSERLRRSLATTNPIESLMSRARHVHRNVKRWRSGKMMIRWMTAAVFEAAKGFRRLKGCKDLPALITALRRRDEQLGLTKPIVAERIA